MLGGLIEAYFNWFYYLLLSVFKIDIDKKIKEKPGLKYRSIKVGIYILADIIGIFVLIFVVCILALLIFLIMYYL